MIEKWAFQRSYFIDIYSDINIVCKNLRIFKGVIPIIYKKITWKESEEFLTLWNPLCLLNPGLYNAVTR